MHVPADPVPGVLSNHVEAIRLNMRLNRGRNVPSPISFPHLIDPEKEGLAGDVYQVLGLGRNLTHRDSQRRVAHEPINNGTAVDADDVSFPQPALPWDRMHQLVVHADRGRGRIREGAGDPQEGWLRPMGPQHFSSRLVDFFSPYSGRDDSDCGCQRLCVHPTRFPHRLQFGFTLQYDSAAQIHPVVSCPRTARISAVTRAIG